MKAASSPRTKSVSILAAPLHNERIRSRDRGSVPRRNPFPCPALTGNAALGRVGFATDGGHFHRAGVPTIVVGPGSIEQAHKPNEYIELEQVAQCERFLERLREDLTV